jgi:hypothetical protein
MSTLRLTRIFFVYSLLVLFTTALSAQANTKNSPLPGPTPPYLEVDQMSDILDLSAMMQRLRTLQAQRSCSSVSSPEELIIRQQLLEAVQTASLDVDGVIGEIDNERGELGNLQATLKARRDRTVAKLNAAALITGSGAGTLANATQFTTLSSRTNNIGDGIGAGSGVASTLLAYLATRKQHGANGTVAETPNMLAPLFDRPAVLNTNYPTVVMRYLQSVPPAETSGRGTRLDQLKAEWSNAGRLDSSDNSNQQTKIIVLTTSGNKDVKISIADLTDRMAMLGDVNGRVALMKRDLALLMRSYMTTRACSTQ